MSSTSGIYIVTLNNVAPISVNAHDPRVAAKAIRVTCANCKFGKTHNLDARRLNYDETFQAENVNFFAIAEVQLDDLPTVEKSILARLRAFQVRGASGRRNEWLVGIDPTEVERIALDVLAASGLIYRQVGSVVAKKA